MAIFPEVTRVQIGSEDAATLRGAGAVSYTHLTLPTKRIV